MIRLNDYIPDPAGCFLTIIMIIAISWIGYIQNSINQSLLSLEDIQKSPSLYVQINNIHIDEDDNLVADLFLKNQGSVPIDGIKLDVRFAFENNTGGIGIKNETDDLLLEPGVEVKRSIKIAAISSINLEKTDIPKIVESHFKVTYKRYSDDREKCIMVSDIPSFSEANLLRDCSKFENPPPPSSGEWRFTEQVINN